MALKTAASKSQNTLPDYIIGIGASAGGLQAIHDLFDNMPETTGFAFVIVQHLSPDYKSLMVELLAKHTRMPVHEAEDGMPVQANNVYAIPSKKIMTLKQGNLCLREKIPGAQPNTAIDAFFESLAAEKGRNAVGIVLSGTGTDGTLGLEAIKQNGGVVIVQEPGSAAFDGMPNSAVGTGLADLVLSPVQIGQELADYLRDDSDVRDNLIFDQAEQAVLQGVLELVRRHTGHDFSHYKKPTLHRRLAKRMSELAIKSIVDYHRHLEAHPEEIKRLDDAFLINVTSFFRDPEAFEQLRIKVIPALLGKRNPQDGIKIWVAACSSGEEAYSIGILFLEHFERHGLPEQNLKIFATDIDAAALETASRGVYPAMSVEHLPAEQVQKYFIAEGSYVRVTPALRKLVIFAPHDVCSDPPFSRMDLVSCRNMLIYTEPLLQKKIMQKFHFALNLDAYLLLGPSENIGVLASVTEEVDRKWNLFRCISKANVFDEDTFPLTVGAGASFGNKMSSSIKNPLNHLAEIFKETLFESERYVGILVDREFNIRQALGAFHHFLQFPKEHFNLSLLKLVSPELALPLGLALRKALTLKEKVVLRHLKVPDVSGDTKRVTLIVKPWLQPKDYQLPFLFVVLEIEETLAPVVAHSTPPVSGNINEQIEILERELFDSRTNLQTVVERMETANEELQSTNEELISTNEELQSTNEELQSLNEELRTVSAEYQLKIKELMDLNDDLNNYFYNSDVAQILIDQNLIIRKFSPLANEVINVIESDIGRSIEDITSNIRDHDFIGDLKKVMAGGTVLEKEIVLNSSNYYLMRIAPYLRRDKSTDGVVVNFINITESKRLTSILEGVFNSSTSGITAKRAIRDEVGRIVDFEYLAVNAEGEKILGRPARELIGRRLRTVFPKIEQETLDVFERVVETGRSIPFVHYRNQDARWFGVMTVKMLDGLIVTFSDITDQKKASDTIAHNYETLKITSRQIEEANNQLERANFDLQQFASVASHDLKEPLRKIKMFGDLLQNKVRNRIEPKEQEYLEKIISSSGRMQILIEDVLTFSKLSNNDEMRYQPTALNPLLTRIAEDLEISIQDKQATLEIDTLPTVNAVPGQMRQLFQNLLTNALKFNDKAKPKIRISAQPLSEEEASELNLEGEDFVRIIVSDNGIGFENEYRDKIFGLFQRLGGRNFEGTGIGLSIAKKIVENHGGSIRAEGRLGEGATFELVLPLAKALSENPV